MLAMDTKVDMVRQELNSLKPPITKAKTQEMANLEERIASLQKSNQTSENLLVTEQAKLRDLRSFIDEYQLPLSDEKQSLKILKNQLAKLQQTLRKLSKTK